MITIVSGRLDKLEEQYKEFWISYGTHTDAPVKEREYEEYKKVYKDYLDVRVFMVIGKEGVIGRALGCVESQGGFIRGVYVRKDKRKMGVGTELLKEVERWLMGQGCAVARLKVSNTDAVEFYKKNGYGGETQIMFKGLTSKKK